MLLVLANHPLGEMSIELDAPYTMAYVPDEFDQYVPRNRGRSKTMHMPEPLQCVAIVDCSLGSQ